MSKISLTPNASGTGNFTIASPNSNTDRTLTLPDATGTVVTDSATQTLTNKTLTSPTLTSPALGTPASGTLTNCTGYPASALPTGSVLQVIQTVKTDTFTTTTSGTTFVDITGMSVSITPSSSSNKVMVFFSVHGATSNLSYVRLIRNSTAIGIGETSGNRISCTVGNFNLGGDGNTSFEWGTNYLDSPATTSSVTYKLQVLNETTNTFCFNRTTLDQNSAAGFRPISQITVMEIKG